VSALTTLYIALTSERPAFLGVEDAAASFYEALGSKRCLIVLDDAWNESHLQPFLRVSSRCAILITTRNHDVARAVGHVIVIGEPSLHEATKMLASYVQGAGTHEDQRALVDLAQRLGEWPLLLKLAAAAISQRIERGATLENALAYVNSAISR